MIKKFNVVKAKKYKNRQGEEKTMWQNCGTYTEFYKDGGQVSRIIEIPAIGLEASIFPIEPKSETTPAVPTINIDQEVDESLPF